MDRSSVRSEAETTAVLCLVTSLVGLPELTK